MKAVLFARVSSREQEETGYSLPAQEKLLREYSEKRGFEIAKIFSISESASGKRQREIFNQMMTFVKRNDISVILCEKADRLTRNLKDAVLIDDWLEKNDERQVHLVKDSLVLHKYSRSQDKLNWGIRIILAKNYIENLSEEIRKGQREKINEGWLPGAPPLGYKSIGKDKHKVPVIDEGKAPLVKKMFEYYAAGNYSLERLVGIMYEEGLRTRMGNKLVRSMMARLLSHPFYYGKICWNGEIYEGKHEPLISKELFGKVQNVLKGKATPKYSKHFYLFKSLIRCYECNCIITWEEHKGIVYGHCHHYRNCSQKTWVKERNIENQFLEVLGDLRIRSKRLAEWIHKALKDSHQNEVEYHKSSLDELNKRYNQILLRLDRLYDDKVDGRISEDFYRRKLKQYSEEKEDVFTAIQAHSKANIKYYELGVSLYELSQRSQELYLKALLEEKRQILSIVFDKLLLDEGKLVPHFSKPFEFLSDVIKETNGSKVPDFTKSPSEVFELARIGSNKRKNREPVPACSVWRRNWDDFRTMKWIDSINYPELMMKQVQQLLH